MANYFPGQQVAIDVIEYNSDETVDTSLVVENPVLSINNGAGINCSWSSGQVIGRIPLDQELGEFDFHWTGTSVTDSDTTALDIHQRNNIVSGPTGTALFDGLLKANFIQGNVWNIPSTARSIATIKLTNDDNDSNLTNVVSANIHLIDRYSRNLVFPAGDTEYEMSVLDQTVTENVGKIQFNMANVYSSLESGIYDYNILITDSVGNKSVFVGSGSFNQSGAPIYIQ